MIEDISILNLWLGFIYAGIIAILFFLFIKK